MNLPPAPRGIFVSDNYSPVHSRYLDAIAAANADHLPAYGLDPHTERAQALLCELSGCDVEVLFTFGGTGSNVVALGSLLMPGESVLCTEWSHINVDETGAPEKILGVKLQDAPSVDGKLAAADIVAAASALGVVHHVQPGVVSLTQATEWGAVYSVEEITEICEVAHAHGMRVHVDGARIANAVAALGAGAAGFRAMTFDAGVDAVSFGGTKNAMLGAEAVLLRKGDARSRAGFLRKQFTQMPSKQRYIGAQFAEALVDGLWLETAHHANQMAALLHDLLSDIGELSLRPPAVNSLYPTIEPEPRRRLQQWSPFLDWDASNNQVRWMTSWDTTTEDIQAFAAGVRAVLRP